jgi:hypothetical protein
MPWRTAISPSEKPSKENMLDASRAAGSANTIAHHRPTSTPIRMPSARVAPTMHASSPSRRATGVPWGAWGVIDLQNFRRSQWKPSLDAAGIQPRRIYDMRHSFATWALDAGLSIFDLSRYMGTSVEMIDRTYGHLAQGAEQSAQAMLDGLRSSFGPRSGHGRKRGGRPEAAIPHEQSSGRWGSNPRPSAWEADALPTELRPRSQHCSRFGSIGSSRPQRLLAFWAAQAASSACR